MNPILIDFGPISLYWYGVLIVIGSIIAAWLSNRYAIRDGEDPDHIWNLLALTLITGIIGARVYHIFSIPADGLGWPYYRENPSEMFNFWAGGFRGLGIYGGLAGGLLGLLAYCAIGRLNSLRYLDYIAPNVLLAQAIGRLGHFINQELYGPPTDQPWAFIINPAYPCQSPQELPQGIQFCGSAYLNEESIAWYANHGYHPTFFYEAGWNLLMFGLLTLLIRYRGAGLRRGDGPLLYFIAYGIGRYWVEFFRPDAWIIGPLAAAQWIAIGSVVISMIILIVRHWGWQGYGDPNESLVQMSIRHSQ
ncbi:MAG: prolipoprotein diacylglyceryl transferase [Chloroflexota bacterium]